MHTKLYLKAEGKNHLGELGVDGNII